MNSSHSTLDSTKKWKFGFMILGLGNIVFIISVILFFIRPYIWDYTDKNLIVAFAIVFVIPGLFITIYACKQIFDVWKKSFAEAVRPRSPSNPWTGHDYSEPQYEAPYSITEENKQYQ